MKKEMSSNDHVRFEVRLIFKNVKSINLDKMAASTRQSLHDLLQIHVKKVDIKRYGLLMTGEGRLTDILAICGNFYTLTNEGGLEIVLHIGNIPTFYLEMGNIHDLREEQNKYTVLPQFDDSDLSESEIDQLGNY